MPSGAELLGDGFKGQVWVTIHEPRWLLPPNMTSSNWDEFPTSTQQLAQVRLKSALRGTLSRAVSIAHGLRRCADAAARAGAGLYDSSTCRSGSQEQARAHRRPQARQLVRSVLAARPTQQSRDALLHPHKDS